MVEAGLAAVVAMQEPVPMDTAQVFARNFYSGLFSHGLVDKAANEARQAVNAHRLWGAHIPVLFMRLPDGRLFTDNTFPLSPNIVESINLTPDDYRNLEDHRNLRQKVKRNWIEGLLQSSLYKEVFIHVGLQDRPSSVHNPLRQYCFHHSARPDVILPPSAHIIDVYERMGQMLLILGEPGSGKTTVLLELARELLVRSMTKQLSPTPVVFNLSSWVERRTPLAEWLVEELNVLYSVDKDRAGSG